MFTFKSGFALIGLTLLGLPALAQEGPALGVVATPEEIAGWDISIGTDGAGLPPGSGTPSVGAEIFTAKCAA
jgi:cytochrome c